MTIIRRTNPLGELISLRQAMDRLFDDSFIRPRSVLSDEHQLALDIRTSADELIVEAALPGVKPEDVNISVLGDTLTISAAHREEESREDEGYSYREIRRGSFTRSVTLPSGVNADAATANFENGLLTLHLPKAEEAKARQIPVSTAVVGSATAVEAGNQPAAQPANQEHSNSEQGA